MSTIIGYNKDGVAISDKSNLIGKEVFIPLLRDGSMLTYTNISVKDFDMEFEFHGDMSFKDIWKGRSAIHFVFEGVTGRPFYMFRSDFVALAKNSLYNINSLVGRFKFNKKGANIGIVYLGE